jgi:murein DD-endopeptidase MepM/ murein hydrolase activator NlpD
MKDFQKIIDSFSIKKELNSKVWNISSDIPKMKPKIREGLLKISEKFIDYLGDDIFVNDIILTGSLSNFNWSEYSDFDIHILVDFEQYGKQIELYQELYKLKKQIFNDRYNIRIFGHDVELYVQDVEESHYASGVYSILEDEWVSEPKKIKFTLDKELLKNKVNTWINKIEETIDFAKKDKNYDKIDNLKEKIKNYRQCGLEKEGELSYENLVFKFLRRSGYIKKLMDFSNKSIDKELSIERNIQEASLESSELLGGSNFKLPSDGAHAGQSGWQSNNAWDIMAPIGTPVYSLTNGTLRTFSDYGPNVTIKGPKKLFGQSFTVSGDDGFPDVYYTHLKDSKVRKGDKVSCGQLLGYIMDFPNSPYDHVHIGVQPPGHIKDLINSDGTIKCSPGVSMGNYSQSEYSDETFDQVANDPKFLMNLKKLIDDNKTFSKGKSGNIRYDDDVKLIQSALNTLGYQLPKHGVDGKFGPETERSVIEFQKDNDLRQTGIIDSTSIWYLLAGIMFKNRQ